MCLIFLKEKSQKPLTQDWCKEVFERNNDGWGITYIQPVPKGKMMVRKGLKFENFWTIFNLLQEKNIDVLVHMRMATQGLVKEFNIHPFILGNTGIAFVHNGVVDYPDMEDDYGYYGGPYGHNSAWSMSDDSDTKQFADKFLTPMLERMEDPSSFIRSKEFEWMINKVGGYSNKFAFSDDRGHVLINKDSWKRTTKGMWVSNTYAFSSDKQELSAIPSSRAPTIYVSEEGRDYVLVDGARHYLEKDDTVIDRSGCVLYNNKKVG